MAWGWVIEKNVFFFFRVLSACDHCHTLVKFLGKKRKTSRRQTPQGTCSKCYGEDGGEDCLKGTEMTSEKKDHLLSQTVRNYVGGME